MEKMGSNKLLKRVLIDKIPLPKNFFADIKENANLKEVIYRENM